MLCRTNIKLATVFARFALMVIAIFSTPTHAASLVWKGDLTLTGLDCIREKVDGVVISGAVTLHHPSDPDAFGPIQTIIIRCANLVFDTGSSLSSISSMDIRVSELTSGPVKIINTRGVKGRDIDNGEAMDRGRHCVGREYYHWGQRGHGEPGFSGVDGGDVTLISKAFAPETTITLISTGGDGGSGGVGHDSGNGGNGGPGGNGGNITVASLASIPSPVVENAGGFGGRPGCGNRATVPAGYDGQNGPKGETGHSSIGTVSSDSLK